MKYVKISRSDVSGSYTQQINEIEQAVNGEFDDIRDMEVGTKVILEVVEMTEEEYNNLPEFMGW